ncbi:MAG TPA: fumarate reductase iron-sulfur subunit, partial [Escherichia coli]|nr:fumarate reductase iron-sulfur subunit [Escherichia coli]
MQPIRRKQPIRRRRRMAEMKNLKIEVVRYNPE